MNFSEMMDRQLEFFQLCGSEAIVVRRARLKSLREVIQRRAEDVVAALASDLGKPDYEAYMSEVVFTVQELDFTRKRLKCWAKKARVRTPFYFWPARSWVERKAFGRVLIFGPWNYPFHLVMAPLISAIAAGNVVVVKPSEFSPAVSKLVEEILGEVFDRDYVSVVCGDGEVAQELLECDFEMIFFTGSTEVGRKVAESAGRRLIPAVLELGGKCGCVVDDDVDLAVVAERVVMAKFFNGGQTCFAPDFVAIRNEVRDEFLVEVKRVMSEVLEGWDGMARIVNETHFDRVLGLCEEGEVTKFGEDDRGALRIAPRILECGWEDAAMREEVFGPVLPVIGFDSTSEVPQMLGSLATYVFSKNGCFVDTMAARMPSGGLCVNDAMKQSMNLRLPFGGVGPSGMGRYRGRYGYEAFSYPKAVAKRYYFKDFFNTLPPYEGAYARMKKFFGK